MLTGNILDKLLAPRLRVAVRLLAQTRGDKTKDIVCDHGMISPRRSEHLVTGDTILAVNGQTTANLTHEEIVNTLRNAGQTVKIKLWYSLPLNSKCSLCESTLDSQSVQLISLHCPCLGGGYRGGRASGGSSVGVGIGVGNVLVLCCCFS